MRDFVDELVAVPEDLVRDRGDKGKAGDETVHFLLLNHLDAELIDEAVIELVRASAGRDDLDTALHLGD